MKLYKLLWENVFKHCKILLLLILLSSSVYAFSLIPIFFQSEYFERLELFLRGNYSFLLLLFWLVVFYITRSISGGFLIPLAAIKDLYYEYSVTRHVRRSQHKINNAVPLEVFDSDELYDLMQRSNEALTSGALRSTVNALSAFLTMAISLISMLISLYVINHYFLLFAILLVIPIFFEFFWFEKKQYILEKRLVTARRRQDFCMNHICDKLYFLQTRLSGTTEKFASDWGRTQFEIERLYLKIQKRRMLFGFGSSVIKSGSIVIMTMIGVKQLADGTMSIGSFSVLLGVIGMMLSYMSFFVRTLSQSIVRIEELREVSAYYDLPQECKDDVSSDANCNEICDIKLENVSFRYSSRRQNALNHINKTFTKGERVAILGLNGAGKTTLTNVIMGLLTPTEGQVKYNSMDVAHLSKYQWRKKITAIFQDYVVYNLSVYDNVRIGNIEEDCTEEQLDQILKDAGFPTNKHPGDSQIGKLFGGIELSKGESQKLAIARSYFNANANVIVIDEPTAALDPIAEEALYQSFIEGAGDKILFLVSHRLGSARIADRILVMDSSVIVEDGTHKELIEKNGLYAKMYREQSVLYDR